VRISELSRTTGVPVATVKYYLREGLLPPGRRTEVNQATYDDTHVERLRFVRVLVEVGGVPIVGVRRVLDALADPERGVHDVVGTVQDTLTPAPARSENPGWADARAEVADLLHGLRWRVRANAPALDQLADILLSTRSVSPDLASADAETCFGLQARAAADLADAEIESLGGGADPAGIPRAAVISTVLGRRAFDALHRLAQEDASARAFGATPDAQRSGRSK
jgi:DNA-binding transcriptional MerR regulator